MELTLAEEEPDTVRAEDTLHHRETLLVVTSRDTEPVSLELIAEGVTGDLLGDALVEERKPRRRVKDESPRVLSGLIIMCYARPHGGIPIRLAHMDPRHPHGKC